MSLTEDARHHLFLGNIDYDATVQDIRSLFIGTHIRVGDIRIIDNYPGRYAFVELATSEQYERAVVAVRGKMIRGRGVRVSKAEHRRRNVARREQDYIREQQEYDAHGLYGGYQQSAWQAPQLSGLAGGLLNGTVDGTLNDAPDHNAAQLQQMRHLLSTPHFQDTRHNAYTSDFVDPNSMQRVFQLTQDPLLQLAAQYQQMSASNLSRAPNLPNVSNLPNAPNLSIGPNLPTPNSHVASATPVMSHSNYGQQMNYPGNQQPARPGQQSNNPAHYPPFMNQVHGDCRPAEMTPEIPKGPRAQQSRPPSSLHTNRISPWAAQPTVQPTVPAMPRSAAPAPIFSQVPSSVPAAPLQVGHPYPWGGSMYMAQRASPFGGPQGLQAHAINNQVASQADTRTEYSASPQFDNKSLSEKITTALTPQEQPLEGSDPVRVYVQGLPYIVDAVEMKAVVKYIFKRFKIVSIELGLPPPSAYLKGRPDCYAWVTLASRQDAQSAIHELHGRQLRSDDQGEPEIRIYVTMASNPSPASLETFDDRDLRDMWA